MEQTFFHSAISAAAGKPRIVLCEADSGLRRSIALSLKHLGLDVWDSLEPGAACDLVLSGRADLFILDQDALIDEPDNICDRIREYRQDSGLRLLVTATQRVGEAWRSKIQPDAVLYKPYDVRFLYRRIVELLEIKKNN